MNYNRYWKELSKIETDFCKKITVLEKKMEKDTGIKGIEFFWNDNEIVGIGSVDRKMKLIHRGGR